MPPGENSHLSWLGKRLQNWISLAGIVLVLASIFAFVLLIATDIFDSHGNNYIGLLIFVVAPIFFIIGLILVLAGVWIQRTHRPDHHPLQIDLARPRDRKLLIFFALCTVLFLLATAFGSYHAFHYTESVQFCGAACHTPMKPEHVAYLHSPHAHVDCVACHVGAGAQWYVRSKINGIHQLYGVVTDSYSRPIKTPVHNMRSAEETCEDCHWAQRTVGSVDKTFQHFLSDDANTPFAVRLLLKVGSGGAQDPASGIHWHTSKNQKIEFVATDEQRQVIPWVRVTDLATGKSMVFKQADFHDDISKYPLKTMDCIDCHSRPAHQFTSPNAAVDDALADGRLDHSIPKLKANVVKALTGSYSNEDEALKKIADTLRADYPGVDSIDGIVTEAQHIYSANFFPEMKTDWRTHPDNIGHKDSAGCFRCHDGTHVTEDGTKSIPGSNCNDCHLILAQGNPEQMKNLKAEGHEFFHIDSPYAEFSCTPCHTGGPSK